MPAGSQSRSKRSNQAKSKRTNAGKILTREEILEAHDVEEETVSVPEWGGSVKIRGFTKAKQLELRHGVIDEQTGNLDVDKLDLLTLLHGIVEPAFTEEDLEALAGKSARATERVLQAILALNGEGKEALEEAERRFLEGSH